MDEAGIERVEKNLDSFVMKMNDSIKKWRKENGSHLPTPPDFVVKGLIEYAIKKAKAS